MTVPYTFANQIGPIPLSELDANFSAVGNLSVYTGNISASGNISANYFIGNGSLLSNINAGNIVGTYSNANVAAYLPVYVGNLNGTLSIGNQYRITNVGTLTTLSVSGNINGPTVANLEGNVSNLQTAVYSLTGNIYNSANVSVYLASGTDTANIVTTANVSGNYILGNGAFLTGIVASTTYSNANVANYLPTYSGEFTASNISATGNVLTGGVVSSTGNVRGGNINTVGLVSATGNITGNYILGDGSLLTNLPAGSYSNANVANYIPTDPYILSMAGNVTTLQGNVVTLTTGLSNTNSNVANVYVSLGNTNSNVVDLETQINSLSGNVYGNANVAAYLPTYGGQLTGNNVSINGNITCNSRINTVGFSASGGIHVLYLRVDEYITATGNVIAGNVTATGNVYGTNFIGNLVSTPTYGAFYDTTTQVNSNVGNAIPMSFNTTDINNGVTIAGTGNTEITIAEAGIYDIQFSAQFEKLSGGDDSIYIWLDKNGTNVPNSAGDITLAGNGAKSIATWNYVVEASAGDYYELVWMSADSTAQIIAYTAASPVPAIPSVILTVVPVGP